MFDDIIVVKSAVSAFNNAALISPAFLWWGILAVPLFVMTYFCGNVFLQKLGWSGNKVLSRSAIVTVILVFLWSILFGGNYGVLRDGVSVLPFLTAFILFISVVFVTSHIMNIKVLCWADMSRRMRWCVIGAAILILLAVGLSDMHAWWGPVLQVCAVIIGFLIGRRVRNPVPIIGGVLLIMTTCISAILMQPEFYRFGQLGNLTVFHILGLLLFGGVVAATLVVHHVTPRNKIHRSAYIKLKWMARFIVLLGCALFFMTESVPVFLGTIAAMVCSCGLSVWHLKSVPAGVETRLFALTLGVFGILTTMPAITGLGILCWTSVSCPDFWHESRFLL